MDYITPLGPFDLQRQRSHFGGWLGTPEEPDAVVMRFPLEDSSGSATVVLRDAGTRGIAVEAPSAAARAIALAAISLDVDGRGWPEVGERDPGLGALQRRFDYLRPVLFHTPYEAAATFIIGHRISIKQSRVIRARIADALGRDGAFPTPQALLAAPEIPHVSAVKAERLRAVAAAVDAGWLRREPLLALAPDRALAQLRTLPGVGPFFAQGILLRGAGTVDVGDNPAWAPFRTWATVLTNVAAREPGGVTLRHAA